MWEDRMLDWGGFVWLFSWCQGCKPAVFFLIHFLLGKGCEIIQFIACPLCRRHNDGTSGRDITFGGSQTGCHSSKVGSGARKFENHRSRPLVSSLGLGTPKRVTSCFPGDRREFGTPVMKSLMPPSWKLLLKNRPRLSRKEELKNVASEKVRWKKGNAVRACWWTFSEQPFGGLPCAKASQCLAVGDSENFSLGEKLPY